MFISISYVCVFVQYHQMVGAYWYGRLVNWFCHRLRAQSTRGRTTTIQSKSAEGECQKFKTYK